VGSFHLRPPTCVMPDTSLPIIDLTYRLVLEVNRAVGELPQSQRPGLQAARRVGHLSTTGRATPGDALPVSSRASSMPAIPSARRRRPSSNGTALCQVSRHVSRGRVNPLGVSQTGGRKWNAPSAMPIGMTPSDRTGGRDGCRSSHR